MISTIVALVESLALGSAPMPPACVLRPVDDQWQGTCVSLIDDGKVTLSIAPTASVVSGVWRRDMTPSEVWSGTLVVGEYPPTPVEIESYDDGSGTMRTVFGWFPVSNWASAPAALHFDLDTSREVAASSVDIEIVERAAAILSSETSWSRADDRKCRSDATTWSIYCAMERATVEVTGTFHHRRPALEVVREIVDERTAGRPYEHRLMDYNNDTTTHFDDVRSLFAEAIQRIERARESATKPAKSLSK